MKFLVLLICAEVVVDVTLDIFESKILKAELREAFKRVSAG
jgi:hypothetical protein